MASRSSSLAAINSSSEAKCLTRAWATTAPTPRMPKAVTRRHKGRSFEASIASNKLATLFSANPSNSRRSSAFR